MSALNRAPFRRVLHRPQLFMGGERELTLMAALISGCLVVSGLNVVAFVVGVTLWFGSIGILRTMAKSDPQMSLVYRRYLKYRGYYHARSRPFVGHTMSASKQWAILLGAPAVLVVLILLAG